MNLGSVAVGEELGFSITATNRLSDPFEIVSVTLSGTNDPDEQNGAIYWRVTDPTLAEDCSAEPRPSKVLLPGESCTVNSRVVALSRGAIRAGFCISLECATIRGRGH